MATSTIISPNACLCPIHNDGTAADRVLFGYLCQVNNSGSGAHWADAGLCTFTTGTPPAYVTFPDFPADELPTEIP